MTLPKLERPRSDPSQSSTLAVVESAQGFLPAPRFRGWLNEGQGLATSELSSVHMSRSRWWSRLACFPSHDGQAIAIFKGPKGHQNLQDCYSSPQPAAAVPQPDLVEVRRDGRATQVEIEFTSIRELRWSPDCRWIAYWAKQAGKLKLLAIDTAEPGKVPAPVVIYDPPEGQVPFAHEWVPSGDGLTVVVRFYEGSEGYSAVYDIPFVKGKAGPPGQVLRMRGHLDWESVPASRFEDGDGPSPEPWHRFYGAYDGLYLADAKGTERKRVAGVAAVGLQNIEWTPVPGKLQAALFFARTSHGEGGEVYRGLHLIDLSSGHLEQLQLHPTVDVHTLWYSPKGTYITWATPEGVFLVPSANPTELLTIPPPEPEAARSTRRTKPRRPGQGLLEPPGITGCYWSPDESKLLFTANDRVYVYVAATGDVFGLTRVDTRNPGFAADPRWFGKDMQTVMFTYFEDIAYERLLLRNRPVFELPLKDGCDQFKVRPGQKPNPPKGQ